MTPAEFDRACRLLEHECPWLYCTSGYRSPERNAQVSAEGGSKHLIGMARDYGAPSLQGMHQAAAVAYRLGLWRIVHDTGIGPHAGDHLHVQGLPPGPIEYWWRTKYGRRTGVRT